MALTNTDIRYHFSTKSGSSGFSLVSNGTASLGKYGATNEIGDNLIHDLFDVVSGDENEGLDVEFRCLFVRNANSSSTLYSAVIWIASEISGGASTAIFVDTTAVSNVGSSAAQAKSIANEDTAPSSQTFSAPTTKGAGLALGTLGPGQWRPVWIRRTCTNSTALEVDGLDLRVAGDVSG